ncbi:MAG: DUF6279 family lipoprotein [Polaromonas sp.]|uniref:DUF6279 family lipoprotein n=1 Tax=Polaromonas sp. TaxID=1869339 RepID=UPI0027356FC1|nr:DUF6279 family lipoprotein [Polaromonas sp.]MDP2819081.1 DUF6279 family lipoprotein [Polaromonas sp.]
MKFPVPCVCGARTAQSGGLLRIIRLTALLALAGLLSACSAVKIAYNQAPELAFLQLDGYFDFSGAQTSRVKEELVKIQRWHRSNQLPAYSDFLKKWQGLLPGDLDEAQVCSATDDLRSSLLAISSRAEPLVAELAGTLAPEQLKFLQRKFSKLNRTYQSDFLEGTLASRIDKRVKKAASRAEMLYGALEEKQLAVLRRQIAQSVFDASLSLAEHQRRQQDALQTQAPLAAGAATATQAKSAIRGYFERSFNSPNPVYRSYQEKLTRDNCKTLALLHNSTSLAQRAKAVQTLADYARDLRILAAQDF